MPLSTLCSIVFCIALSLTFQAWAHDTPPLLLIAMIDSGAMHCQKAVPKLAGAIGTAYEQWNSQNHAIAEKLRRGPKYKETVEMLLTLLAQSPVTQQQAECESLLKIMSIDTGERLVEIVRKWEAEH